MSLNNHLEIGIAIQITLKLIKIFHSPLYIYIFNRRVARVLLFPIQKYFTFFWDYIPRKIFIFSYNLNEKLMLKVMIRVPKYIFKKIINC